MFNLWHTTINPSLGMAALYNLVGLEDITSFVS